MYLHQLYPKNIKQIILTAMGRTNTMPVFGIDTDTGVEFATHTGKKICMSADTTHCSYACIGFLLNVCLYCWQT